MQQNNLGSPFLVFRRNIRSLILREMRTRFGGHSLGYIWALLEPLGMIMALALIFSTGLKGREPALGDSYILFFTVGLIPFTAYRATQQAVNKAMRGGKTLLFFPIIKPIDNVVAMVVLDTLTLVIVMNTVFVVYWIMYGSGLPDNVFMTVLPVFYVATIGFSFGVINNALSLYVPSWPKFWKIANKPMFFISGIFYLAESLPPNIQKILWWNPILHAVEWARSGYFGEWNSKFASLYYLHSVIFILFFTALLLERTMRRQFLSSG